MAQVLVHRDWFTWVLFHRKNEETFVLVEEELADKYIRFSQKLRPGFIQNELRHGLGFVASQVQSKVCYPKITHGSSVLHQAHAGLSGASEGGMLVAAVDTIHEDRHCGTNFLLT